MRRTRAILAAAGGAMVLVAPLSGAAVVPAAASGRIVVSWTYASRPGATATVHETGRLVYTVSGSLLGERARRAYAPVSFPAGYKETSLPAPAYVPARLKEASLTRTFTMPCADGGSADFTTSIASVVDPRAVLTHDETLALDVLRHRGAMNLKPYFRVRRVGAGIVDNSRIWRPLGVVRKEITGTKCPENVDRLPAALDVSMLLPRWVPIMWSYQQHLVLARVQPDGTVVLRGTSQDRESDHGEITTIRVDVNLSLRGTLPGMDARCSWPLVRDLASATTEAQALAIVRRAGLETSYGGIRPNRDVPLGRFYIHTADSYWICGTPLPHVLYRNSL